MPGELPKVVPIRRRPRKPPTLKQLMARKRRDTRKLVIANLATFALTIAVGLAWPQLSRQFVAGATWPVIRSEPATVPGRGDTVRIVRVIDGDTVDLAGGERVRILNIDGLVR